MKSASNNAPFVNTSGRLEQHLCKHFPSVLEPHERLGTMSTIAIQSLFQLHPYCILLGWKVQPLSDGSWAVVNVEGKDLFRGKSALDCANWLSIADDENRGNTEAHTAFDI